MKLESPIPCAFCRIDVCSELRLIHHYQIEVAGLGRPNGVCRNLVGLNYRYNIAPVAQMDRAAVS